MLLSSFITLSTLTSRTRSKVSTFGEQSPCPKAQVHMPMFIQEFGVETMIAVPGAYWLHHHCGKLASTRSCGDVAAWYWFSPNHTNDMDCKGRAAANQKWRLMLHPIRWAAPPHRAHYLASEISWPRRKGSDRSIYVINKYHGQRHKNDKARPDIHNRFKWKDLDGIFAAVNKECATTDILYYRNFGAENDLIRRPPSDNPTIFPNNQTDWEWIQQFPFVHTTRDAFRQSKLALHEYNAFHMKAMSHHNCFISVQGGDQWGSTWFGGQHVVLHYTGFELKYNFYNKIQPKFAGAKITVASNGKELLRVVESVLLKDACSACTLSV